MFGDVTFAQAPFASLGGKVELASLSEAAVASAESDALTNFGGEIAESSTGSETVSVSGNLTATQAETSQASETQSAARFDGLYFKSVQNIKP